MQASNSKKIVSNSVLGSPQVQLKTIIADISPPPCKQTDRKVTSSFETRKANP